MLLGQILFLLAVIAIAAATFVGVVWGVGRLVFYKLTGRPLGPRPAMGSTEWLRHQGEARVDLARQSLLTEPFRHTTDDPVVDIEGDRYRVTRLRGGRFLITQVGEGRRVGVFELAGEGRHPEILPTPDDPANSQLLVHIAVLSSHVRRDAGRVVPRH
jgi:hypothetical protein